MNELISHAKGRGEAYALLANCFHLPDEGLIQALNELPESDSELYSVLANAVEIRDVDSLRIDYSKLFVGPYKLLAPPYGSVYLEGTSAVMGRSTVDVLARYKVEGVAVRLKEAPDHIAIELEFMFFLISKEIEGLRDSDLGSAEAYQKKQKDFLEVHLGKWIPQFTEKVETLAQTQFYTDLARSTRDFVLGDLRRANTGD